MFFQSKKKRLWRARVLQTATHHANPQHSLQQQQQSQQPQLLRQLHSHRHCFQSNPQKSEEQYVESSCLHSKLLLEDVQNATDGRESATSGCYYESGNGEASNYDDDQTMSSVVSTTSIGSSRMITGSPMMRAKSSPTTATSTVPSSMAATAASVLLNCCGGNSSGSAYSNHYTNLNANNLNNNNENPSYMNVNDEKQLFRGLMSKLKESQLTTLCQAVEKTHATDGGGHQPECVLVPRGTILGEEPNVIACRLWRWPDIKSANELKSIPSCPSEKDRVYVCCNPSHWSRLCVPDTPPPPYQVFAVDRLKPEDRAPSENVDGLRVQFPESLTTDGEESSTSSTWCQLAYWELAQRVGGRFPVENSSVNVFSDQPQGDGMCLKTLAEQRQSETPESVLKARQKIGLGVTLSHEADGVWLYNRSSVPVFVHSPTLNDVDYWFHVSKVPPGYCLRAFDSYRAKFQQLVWPPQIAGAQTGPVDTHSMRISFAKGWGPNYSRQDVTACPCWLEVLLTRR